MLHTPFIQSRCRAGEYRGDLSLLDLPQTAFKSFFQSEILKVIFELSRSLLPSSTSYDPLHDHTGDSRWLRFHPRERNMVQRWTNETASENGPVSALFLEFLDHG